MLEHFASKLRKILNVVFESLYFLEHSCLKQAIYSPGIVFIEIPLVIRFQSYMQTQQAIVIGHRR